MSGIHDTVVCAKPMKRLVWYIYIYISIYWINICCRSLCLEATPRIIYIYIHRPWVILCSVSLFQDLSFSAFSRTFRRSREQETTFFRSLGGGRHLGKSIFPRHLLYHCRCLLIWDCCPWEKSRAYEGHCKSISWCLDCLSTSFIPSQSKTPSFAKPRL